MPLPEGAFWHGRWVIVRHMSALDEVGVPAGWKPSRRLSWLADPSWTSGVASIFDVLGTATWAAPWRFTEEASSRMMHEDLVVVGRDFRLAMKAQTLAEGLDESQIQLFDPAAFNAAR